MTQVYVVKNDGSTESMNRVRSQNENRDLQRLLERNPDLLPGEQIDPDQPRRWLLVKREMPVPDPSTGSDRWSVDFFFVDQDATPTFVECKRFDDTRSRREVVGQMLEYAANGHHYWTKAQIRDFAEAAARSRGLELEQAIQQLGPTDTETVDAFFDRVQENLRQAQLRIVFFLDEAPQELRSVVDFLNRQMERSEVLLVEARQYDADGRRVVVPTLFGYTEQARMVKRAITVRAAGERRRWDRDSFFADAAQRLDAEGLAATTDLYEAALSLGCDVSWGTGKDRGSYSVRDEALCPRSLISVYSDGILSLNSLWTNGSPVAEALRDRLAQLLSKRLGIPLPEDFRERMVTASINVWGPERRVLIEILTEVLTDSRKGAA